MTLDFTSPTQWYEWVTPATTHPVDARTTDHITIQRTVGAYKSHTAVEIGIGSNRALLTLPQARALRYALTEAIGEGKGQSFTHLVTRTR